MTVDDVPLTRRRRLLFAVLYAATGAFVLLMLVALVVSAQAARASAEAARQTAHDFADYRHTQDIRSAQATKDRAALADQVARLTRLLRQAGIDPSPGKTSSSSTQGPANGSSSRKTTPHPSTPKRSRTSSKPPTPSSPAPSAAPTCVVNVLGICI